MSARRSMVQYQIEKKGYVRVQPTHRTVLILNTNKDHKFRERKWNYW